MSTSDPCNNFCLLATVANQCQLARATLPPDYQEQPCPAQRAEHQRVRLRDGNQEATNLILGLVTSQWFLDEEAKMIYGTTKIRHRLGLANIIHASFIKEAIDLLE